LNFSVIRSRNRLMPKKPLGKVKKLSLLTQAFIGHPRSGWPVSAGP
jgi:hypothetical protein